MGTETLTQVSLDRLAESPLNTRRIRDEGLDAELRESIKARGVLNALLVRKSGKGYEILAGSRRYRAAKQLKLKSVPVKIMDLDDEGAKEVVIIDNLQRADVHPLDEADGYVDLLEKSNYDYEGVAGKVKKARSYVVQRAKLANLSESWRKAWTIKDYPFTIDHAFALARMEQSVQESAYKDFKHFPDIAQLRRHLEEHYLLDLRRAPWDLNDAKLIPEAGSCKKCPKRSGSNKDLFDDLGKQTCTDKGCFMAKAIEYGKAKAPKGVKVCLVVDRKAKDAPDNVILPEEFHQIINRKGCEYEAVGVIAILYWRNFGRTERICTGLNKCPVHRDQYGVGVGGDRPKPTKKQREKKIEANRKARRQLEENHVTLDMVMMKWKPDVQNVRIITRTFWERLWGDAKAAVAMRRGWIQKRSELYNYDGKGFDFDKELQKMSIADCQSFMLEASVVNELGRQSDPKLGPTIRDLAKRCKVSAKEVGKRVDAREADRLKKKAARVKEKAAAKSKAKKTKSKAAKK